MGDKIHRNRSYSKAARFIEFLMNACALVGLAFFAVGFYLMWTGQADLRMFGCMTVSSGLMAVFVVLTNLGTHLKQADVRRLFPRVCATCTELAIERREGPEGDGIDYRPIIKCLYQYENREWRSSPHVFEITGSNGEQYVRDHLQSRIDSRGQCTLAVNPQNPDETYLLPLDTRSARRMWIWPLIPILCFIGFGFGGGVFEWVIDQLR
ncbi:MAG: hypothetical protein ABIZ56_06400 [Chthoniobacteraceae bacterium]